MAETRARLVRPFMTVTDRAPLPDESPDMYVELIERGSERAECVDELAAVLTDMNEKELLPLIAKWRGEGGKG